MTNADYPYTGLNAQTCKHDKTKIVVKAGINGKVTATTALARLQLGPLSIGVSANNDVFRYYKSGILYSGNLCPTNLNHAVFCKY